MKALVRPVIDQGPPLDWVEVECEATGEMDEGAPVYKTDPESITWHCTKRPLVTGHAWEFKVGDFQGKAALGTEFSVIYGSITLDELSFSVPEVFNPEDLLQLERDLSEMGDGAS